MVDSKVVLMVVSSASIKSKWLKFEINKATEKMVEGHCRVIPIIKERVSIPAEVQGLLYADFTSSFQYGIKSVLTALGYEAKKNFFQLGFWAQIDILLQKIFKTSSISILGEYKSQDYDVLSLPTPNRDGEEETTVVYEVVSSYG